MYKSKSYYISLLVVSLLLPLLELGVFGIIYSTFFELAVEISACYIPISIISSAFLIYLMASTRHKNCKKHICYGYFICVCLTVTVSILLKETSHIFVSNILGGTILLGGLYLSYITRPKNNPFYIK